MGSIGSGSKVSCEAYSNSFEEKQPPQCHVLQDQAPAARTFSASAPTIANLT